MKLSPQNIRQQKFRRSLWGVDGVEVDAFLEEMAHDVQHLLNEIEVLRQEVVRKDEAMSEYREREQTLKDTMITATRITEDIKQNARKEAELIIAKAESQAEQIVHNAHNRLVQTVEDIDELKRQRTQFEVSLRAAIDAHSRLIDSMGRHDMPLPRGASAPSAPPASAQGLRAATGPAPTARARAPSAKAKVLNIAEQDGSSRPSARPPGT